MKTLIKLISLFLLAGFLLAGLAFYQLDRQMDQKVLLDEGKAFTIEHGQSMKAVAMALQKQKIIDHAQTLYWYSRIKHLSHKLKAGEYWINAEMTIRQVLQQFVQGKVRQYAFTIIEGWNIRELLRQIRNNPYLLDDLSPVPQNRLMQKLVGKQMHPEGQFLPDTYLFEKNTKASQLLQRAHQALQKYLQQLWVQHDKNSPLKSAYEALILASIVEKETAIAEERAKIAGVFINRLNKGMKLQTDPTVIYGMGDKYKGDIRFRDLRTYTPYNTYKIKGLPPTPIAMPGREAIRAVIFPQKTDALYFVAMGGGRHYFSATLKEHNRAVNKYQRKRK